MAKDPAMANIAAKAWRRRSKMELPVAVQRRRWIVVDVSLR
jgi:hypothetical protein